MEGKRRKFQGVLNILSFNRHFYYWGLLVMAALLAACLLMKWPHAILWIITGAFLYGLLMPLIVSAYVYDFSGYYEFGWIKDLFNEAEKVRVIANINAGFDETSFIIEDKFPGADIRVFDFYDARRHTEPAIKRARKVSQVYPNTRQIPSNLIPLESRSADIVFLLSAVHEIRAFDEKVRFLMECHRVCKPDGKIVMVEHLRDFPNFLAFSVGFTHFFSAAVWKKAFKRAGFSRLQETKFTPFISIFDCSP